MIFCDTTLWRSYLEAFMANEEHVALLKQGVDAWNAWRLENPKLIPDLSQANLNGADLRKMLLPWTNLRKANLRDANLSQANLLGTNLHDADLRDADLGCAHLP